MAQKFRVERYFLCRDGFFQGKFTQKVKKPPYQEHLVPIRQPNLRKCKYDRVN